MGTTCSIWVGWNDRKCSYIFVFYVKLEILLGKAKGNIFPLQFPDSQLSSMPRSVRPASLKNSCIHFIAKNEDLWSQPDISCLVAPVIEKLLKAVLGRVQKARHLWWNFQNSEFFGVPINHVEYLQWNPLELFSEDTSSLLLCESIDDAFTKFLQRCRQLTHLKLNTLGSPLGGRVYDLLSGCDLSNLWVLNMDHMELGNDALGVIGSCCPKLRELRLGCVSGVNDDTLKLLIKKGPDGQCVLRHLKVLDLESTGVWDFGIQYALTSIPTIAHLNHYRMLPAALELLHRGSVITPFQLEKLDVRDMNVLFCIDQNCAGYPLDMSAFSKVKDIAIVLEYHKELELLKGFYPLLKLDKLGPFEDTFLHWYSLEIVSKTQWWKLQSNKCHPIWTSRFGANPKCRKQLKAIWTLYRFTSILFDNWPVMPKFAPPYGFFPLCQTGSSCIRPPELFPACWIYELETMWAVRIWRRKSQGIWGNIPRLTFPDAQN